MAQFNRFIATLLVILSSLLAIRELQYRERRAAVPPTVTVYLTGEVARPGTVSLPQGARRIHALEYCGGVTSKADLSGFEPARPLIDGESLRVSARPSAPPAPRAVVVPPSRVPEPWPPPAPSGTSEGAPKPLKISLNRAGVEELQQLPGIGPVLAKRIVTARNERPEGTFSSIEDLATIRGIRRKTMARLRPYLELEGI